MLPSANKIWWNPLFRIFRNIILWTRGHKIFRGHIIETPSLKTLIFTVICYLHLYNSSPAAVSKTRCFFSDPTLACWGTPSPEPTYFATPQSTAVTGPKPPKYLFIQCEVDVDSVDQKLAFFELAFLKKNIDVEQKTELKMRKTKIRNGDLKEKRREETNKNEKGLMNKGFVTDYFDVVLSWKKSKGKTKRKKRQKQEAKRKQKNKKE